VHFEILRAGANAARNRNFAPGMTRARPESVQPKSSLEPWTIPFHVIMWATLLGGLIMVIVVVLMHR
jgi:hypothetical protein